MKKTTFENIFKKLLIEFQLNVFVGIKGKEIHKPANLS